MNYTDKLAKYTSDMKYEELPGEVVWQAKKIVLHTLAAALAACNTKQGRDAAALAKEQGGGVKQSTILGHREKVSSTQAAFANGTLADILDWEDCSWTGHPSANVIPAALAVSECTRASGKELITAIVAGYEVYQRVAMAVQPSAEWNWFEKGWGLTSWEIFAGAMPAAKLLNPDAKTVAQTMGIAVALTPIVNIKVHNTRTDFYHYQHGLTCRDGVTAALIANKGITSLDDSLDGSTGYWVSLSDQCRWEWFDRGLGQDYLIMETYMKHWPSNMWIQQPLDALDLIIRNHKIRAEEIEEIIVSPQFQHRTYFREGGYDSVVDAEFSIPYCLAVRLLDKAPGPNWYSEDRFNDQAVLDLAGRIKSVGPEMKMAEAFDLFRGGSYPEVKVVVRMKNGESYTRDVKFPKGHKQNSFTEKEISAHFLHGASFALNDDDAGGALEQILNLEKVKDVSEITALLSKGTF